MPRRRQQPTPPGPREERDLVDYMASLPKDGGSLRLLFWRPDESPQLLDLEPDAYWDKVFGFVLDQDLDADWWTSATLMRDGPRLIVSRLTIEPNTIKHPAAPPPRGIGSAQARAVRIGELVSRALREVEATAEGQRLVARAFPQFADDKSVKLADVAAEEAREHRPRRGRPPTADPFYEQVARLYLELQGKGWGRGIIGEIARREICSPDTARDRVKEARKRGFLMPGVPGRAGAEAGPRLAADPEQKKKGD